MLAYRAFYNQIYYWIAKGVLEVKAVRTHWDVGLL